MPNIINTVIPVFRRGSRKKVSKMSHEMIMGWCRKWSSNVSCSRRTWPADNQNSCVALSLKLQWGQKVYADTLWQSQFERNVVFHFQQWILYTLSHLNDFLSKFLLEGVPRYTIKYTNCQNWCYLKLQKQLFKVLLPQSRTQRKGATCYTWT